jgi:hypothetical protein
MEENCLLQLIMQQGKEYGEICVREKTHCNMFNFLVRLLKSADYYSSASIEESPCEPVLLPIFCSFYEILFALVGF